MIDDKGLIKQYCKLAEEVQNTELTVNGVLEFLDDVESLTESVRDWVLDQALTEDYNEIQEALKEIQEDPDPDPIKAPDVEVIGPDNDVKEPPEQQTSVSASIGVATLRQFAQELRDVKTKAFIEVWLQSRIFPKSFILAKKEAEQDPILAGSIRDFIDQKTTFSGRIEKVDFLVKNKDLVVTAIKSVDLQGTPFEGIGTDLDEVLSFFEEFLEERTASKSLSHLNNILDARIKAK